MRSLTVSTILFLLFSTNAVAEDTPPPVDAHLCSTQVIGAATCFPDEQRFGRDTDTSIVSVDRDTIAAVCKDPANDGYYTFSFTVKPVPTDVAVGLYSSDPHYRNYYGACFSTPTISYPDFQVNVSIYIANQYPISLQVFKTDAGSRSGYSRFYTAYTGMETGFTVKPLEIKHEFIGVITCSEFLQWDAAALGAYTALELEASVDAYFFYAYSFNSNELYHPLVC